MSNSRTKASVPFRQPRAQVPGRPPAYRSARSVRGPGRTAEDLVPRQHSSLQSSRSAEAAGAPRGRLQTLLLATLKTEAPLCSLPLSVRFALSAPRPEDSALPSVPGQRYQRAERRALCCVLYGRALCGYFFSPCFLKL